MPRPLTETDWAALLDPVARELLGDPVRRPSSGEWRYRRKGSLAVHGGGPHRGTWRDHEADVGGGVLELLAHVEGLNRAEALEWLRHRGLLDGPRTDAGRGASRFSGRAAARHRTLPKNGSTGLSGPGENPDRAEKRDVRARPLAGSGTVHIWADQHAPGFAAAEILGRMVVGEANTTVSVEHVGVGEDPGAAGAPTFKALAADLQRDGLPAWGGVHDHDERLNGPTAREKGCSISRY